MRIQRFRYIFVAFALMVGVLFLLGKTRYIINPVSRYVLRISYVGTIKNDKRIDAEKFWEFRDFYFADTSSFKQENIKEGKPFLIFSNQSIQSLDFLVLPSSSLGNKFVIPNGAKIILQSKNEVVYEEGNRIVIKFTKEVPEMQKVNGYFSYFGVDLKKYDSYLWYNESTIYQ